MNIFLFLLLFWADDDDIEAMLPLLNRRMRFRTDMEDGMLCCDDDSNA